MTLTIPPQVPRSDALRLLTVQDVVIRGFGRTWPYPRWIKILHDGEAAPRMAWMNGAYRHWYSVTLDQYVDKTDAEVWGDDVAREFVRADLAAIATPETLITVREPTPRAVGSAFCLSTKMAYRVDMDGINGWAIYGECKPE